jgi:hypothetical protein
MQIRILATDLPGTTCGPSPDEPAGYTDIRVGVQRRNKPTEVDGLHAGDAASARWDLPCTATQGPNGLDLRGPHLQGGPGGRFLYLSWIYRHASGEDRMFRRAKLMLEGVPKAVLWRAAETGMLVGQLGLTDDRGHPTCAAVRPPQIRWRAGS